MTVQGQCRSEEIMIYLAPRGTRKALYSSGAVCKNGEFLLDEDLSQWVLPEGDYDVILGVNGVLDYSKSTTVNVKKKSKKMADNTPITPDPLQSIEPKSSQINETVSQMSTLIADLEIYVDNSTYPTPAKTAITFLLDAMKDSIDRLSSLLLHISGTLPIDEPVVPSSTDSSQITGAPPAIIPTILTPPISGNPSSSSSAEPTE